MREPSSSVENVTSVVEIAAAAGQHLATQLGDLRRALEAGQEDEALRLACEITKVDRRVA